MMTNNWYIYVYDVPSCWLLLSVQFTIKRKKKEQTDTLHIYSSKFFGIVCRSDDKLFRQKSERSVAKISERWLKNLDKLLERLLRYLSDFCAVWKKNWIHNKLFFRIKKGFLERKRIPFSLLSTVYESRIKHARTSLISFSSSSYIYMYYVIYNRVTFDLYSENQRVDTASVLIRTTIVKEYKSHFVTSHTVTIITRYIIVDGCPSLAREKALPVKYTRSLARKKNRFANIFH